MTHVKICCMRDPREVELALKWGATALGFVVTASTGPGVVAHERAQDLMQQVGDRGQRWLLTAHTQLDAIAAQIEALQPTHVQICDTVPIAHYARLRERFAGVQLLQVIHVSGPHDVQTAIDLEPHVHGLLLDTGAVVNGERQLGGTGKTHDWNVSSAIVQAVKVPVWLAGGLSPDNVAAAIHKVAPFGVDLCSGVRDAEYALDADKLRAFLTAVRDADGPILLPDGASLADYQRYIHQLEALHGWHDVDLVHNCFLMGEEVGELFKAVRRVDKLFVEGQPNSTDAALAKDVAHEVVDVLNYLLAVANRLNIDVEQAFREKNAINQDRRWT